MGGLTGSIFLIGLALAFISGHFLFVVLVDLAICSLTGALASSDIQANYGGFQGFVFLLGLAVLTLIGFWPWILVLLGISSILGALSGPVIVALGGWLSERSAQPRPKQDPLYNYPPPTDAQAQRSYQEGYQAPAQETYQEGGSHYTYPGQAESESVQAQYPQQQQLPPQY